MARPRSDLSEILHRYCDRVYFQPPANLQINYPCIIYNLDTLNGRFADNGLYNLNDVYTFTYITRDPDDENIRKFLEIPYCSFSRSFESDNLHHYNYRIYL